MADIRIIPAQGAINVTGSADFRGDSASTVLYVSGSGNVGVGTSNPISKLHVAGAIKGTATTGHVLGTSTDTSRALSILNSGLAHGESYSLSLGYANSSNNQAEITYFLSATGSTSNRLSLGLYNSSDTVNILGTGNVGIGITNPGAKLTVAGNVRINGNIDYSAQVGITQPASGNALNITNQSDADLTFYITPSGAATKYALIQPSVSNQALALNTQGGNVGIGLTNPATKFHIYGSSNDIGTRMTNTAASKTFMSYVDTGGNYIVYDATVDDNRFIIYSAGSAYFSGNVGIGITNPSYKLHTIGQVAVQGDEADLWLISTGGGAGVWRILGSAGNTTKRFRVYDNDNGVDRFNINATGSIKFNAYGSGTFTGTAAYNLSVDSSGNIIETANTSLTGTGTANRVAYWTGTSTLAADADFFFDGTNVGIGTTSPGAKLQVAGSGIVNDNLTVNGRYFVNNNTALAFKYAYNQLSRGNGTLIADADAADGNAIYMNSTGSSTMFFGPYTSMAPGEFVASFRLKVGSNSSTSQLGTIDIIGTGVTGSAVVITPSMFETSNRYQYIDIPFTVNASTSNIEFRGVSFNSGITDTYLDHVLIKSQAKAYTVYQPSNKNYDIYYTGVGTPRLRINTDGNVGIGTNSPTFKLEVNGSALLNGSLFLANTLARISSDTSGEVGINYNSGNTSTYSLSIYDSTSRVAGITKTGGGYFDGSVGIGTASPAQKLEVNGNIKLSSTVGSTSTPSYIWLGNDFSNGATKDKLKVYLYNAGGGEQYGFSIGSSGDVQYHSNVYHDFYVDNSRKFRISSAGADVTGDLTVSGKITAREFHTTFVSASIIYQSGSTQFGNSSDDTHIFTGNVGIGTSSPSELLELQRDGKVGFGMNGSYGVRVGYFDDGGGIHGFHVDTKHVGTVTTRRFVVRADSGNVGINTYTPGFKLDVVGDARISTNLSINGYSVTDGIIYHGSNINVLNKASNGWLTWATRNTSPAEVVVDLNYLGSVAANSFTGSLQGNASTATSATSATYAGYVINQGGQLLAYDNRTISPSETSAGYLQFGFTAYDNNSDSPWADYLHLRSYTDGSGGNDNLVVFKRTGGIGMRIYQQSYGSSTAYATYKDVAFTDSNISGNAATATTASFALTAATAVTATGETLSTITGRGASTSTETSFNATVNAYRLILPQNTVGTTYAGVSTQPTYYIGQTTGDNDAWKIYGESGGGTNTGTLVLQSEDDFDGNESIVLRFKRTYSGYNTTDALVAKFDRVYTNVSLGVGTTAPSNTLHVAGTAYVSSTVQTDGDIYISKNGGVLYYDRPNGATVGGVGWHSDDYFYVAGHPSYGPTAGNAVRVYGFGDNLYLGNSAAGDVVTVTTGGNVGIGSTAPIYALDMYNTGAATARVRVRGTSNYALLQAQNSGGVLYMGIDDSGGGGFSNGAYSRIIWSSGNYPLIFAVGDTPRVRITPGGTLLVSGSVTPSESNWKGTAVFGQDTQNKVIIGTLVSTYTGATIGGHNSALTGWDDLNIVGGNVIFRYQETEYARFNTSGNLGIGVTNPSAKLYVAGDSVITGKLKGGTFSDSYIEFPSSGNTILKANNEVILGYSSDFYVTQGGNVGIGITNPSHKLYVVGSVANRTLWEVTTAGMGASGTQARRYEIARAFMDYNDWNSSGTIEVELRENYYSKGLYKKYVIYWGYNNSSGIHLTEMSGDGDNNFQVTIGSPVNVSGDNYYVPIYAEWKYYTGGIATIRTNRTRTSSTSGGIGTIYVDEAPSPSNISDFTADSKVTIGYPSSQIILGPSANVGIGTTSPVSRLHVTGTNPRISTGTITAGSNNGGVYDADHIIIGEGGSISIGAERRGDWGLDGTTATSTTFRSRLNIWSDNEDHVTFGGASTHIVTAWEDFKIWINNDSTDAGILHLYNKAAKTEFARFSGGGDSWLNGGNVGIGLTSPGAKLEVDGTWKLGDVSGGSFKSYTYGTNLDISGLTSGGWARAHKIVTSDSSGHVFFGVLGDTTTLNKAYWTIGDPASIDVTGYNSSNGITLLKNGNVGIGSASPGSRLTVVGANSSTVPLIDLLASGTGTFQRGVRLLNGGMNAGDHLMMATGYADSSKNMGQFYFYYAGNGSNSNRLSLGLHSVDDVLNIAGTSNVGIGTTAPAYKLSVNGTTSTSYIRDYNNTRSGDDGHGGIDFSNNGIGYQYAAKIFTFRSTSNSEFYGFTNDYGSGTPGAELSIISRLNISGYGSIGFYTGASTSPKMWIDPNGNVGIGTISPKTDLHVWTGTTGNSVEAARFTGAYAGTGDGPLLRFTNYLSYATNPNSGEYNLAGIRAFDFASAWGGGLQFLTAVDTNGGGNLTAAMTIDSSQRVGIGTTSPSSRLHVQGAATDNVGLAFFENTHSTGGVWHPAAQFVNTRGDHSYGIVAGFKIGSAAGSDRPSILFYNSTGAKSWQVGQITSGWGNNDDFGIGYRASNDPDGFNTWPTNYFTITSAGNVGVGSTSPAYKLDVSGTIRATGDVIAYSDARVKENVVTLENSLELVTKLRGVEYNKIGETEKKIGVIAQEVLEVVPQVVQQDQDGNYSVAYGNMAGLFIEAIKQQQTYIQALEARIQKLEEQTQQKL